MKVTFSVPALLGWFVAAVVVTLLLYPMLGRIATALAGSGHARSPACPGCDDAAADTSDTRRPATGLAATMTGMRIVVTDFARPRLFPREPRRNTIQDISAEAFEQYLNRHAPEQEL